MRLDAYLHEWLEGYRTGRMATYVNYEGTVRRYLIPLLGSKNISELTPMDIQAALSTISKPRTRQLALSVLSSALSVLVEFGQLQKNPAAMKRLKVRVTKKPVDPLSPTQTRQLLTCARTDPLAGIWTVLVHTGLRLGEVLALHWDDVDLDNGMLTVRAKLQEIKGKILGRAEPKSRAGYRTIPLTQVCIDLLRSIPKDSHIVFHKDGGYLHQRFVERRYKALLQKAGLPDKRVHDLRHGTASAFISTGADIKTVQTILGHSRASVTLDTYGHLFPGQTHEAVKRMEAVYA